MKRTLPKKVDFVVSVNDKLKILEIANTGILPGSLTYEFTPSYYKEGDYNSEVAYMGCRTRVMANVYDPTREIVTGRGNLSFTSVNLPRLGIEAKGDIDKFYEMLDEKITFKVK